MARIFVGIPTFKRPKLVAETIDSLRAQTFTDFRAVVSDNRSDAASTERVRAYVAALRDPRFTFHLQPENRGEYGQGRFFLAAAKDEEFFAILHDDDLLRRDYLARGVDALERHRDAAFFVANAYAMDATGLYSPARTAQFLREQGRIHAPEGLFDVLNMHVMHGFAPISGTLFRKDALVASGFVDPDCHGNYPFEANVFLRLGERGAKAWFTRAELVGFRFHGASLRNQHLIHDAAVIRTSIGLWSRRTFTGTLERRRKALLSRFYRADALIRLRERDLKGARHSISCAFLENPRSCKLWAVAPLVFFMPTVLRALLPSLSDRIGAPRHRAVPASADSDESEPAHI